MAHIPATLLLADCEHLFADWSQPVTYRQVTYTCDPHTLQRTATPIDTPLNAIRADRQHRSAPNTAGLSADQDVAFLVKRADLPESPPAFTSQILDGDQTWQILASETSADQLTLRLTCRRI